MTEIEAAQEFIDIAIACSSFEEFYRSCDVREEELESGNFSTEEEEEDEDFEDPVDSLYVTLSTSFGDAEDKEDLFYYPGLVFYFDRISKLDWTCYFVNSELIGMQNSYAHVVLQPSLDELQARVHEWLESQATKRFLNGLYKQTRRRL